uniref:Uncharacterized protein n=1 Tax=Rhipicephalus microplus TaxID=6941 RepID=A0A6G5AG52_RHIMP
MLKTGIVTASQKSNVSSSASFCSSRAVTIAQVDGSTVAVSVNVKLAQQALRELCMLTSSFLPTPHMAAIALVAGYISRVVSEKTVCDSCISLVQNPEEDFGMDGLIAHQDRGGLFYPTQQLIRVLHALKRYVDIMLSDCKSAKAS